MVKAIAFPVDGEPTVIDMPNTLEAWQAYVGGYVESVTLVRKPGSSVALLCNEDGVSLKLPLNPNTGVFGYILGNFLVARFEDGDMVDVTDADVTRFLHAGVDR